MSNPCQHNNITSMQQHDAPVLHVCTDCGGRLITISPISSRADFTVCEQCGEPAAHKPVDGPRIATADELPASVRQLAQ